MHDRTMIDANTTHPMQLLVESTGVADRLALGISPPKRRLGGFAIGADEAAAAGDLKGEMFAFWIHGT